MSASTFDKLTVEDFALQLRPSMVPLSNTFSYFAAIPLSEEDVKEYLEEPIAAIPPGIAAMLPKVFIGLVPYLEKRNGKDKDKDDRRTELVSFEKPSENRDSPVAKAMVEGEASLVFAIKDQAVADYHYTFYRAIAALIAERATQEQQEKYFSLLREELGGRVHGEVDRESWHEKQALMRRQTNIRRETKLFRDYAQKSLIDTLTLYLHGICCDIDVETGPRQLPSRCLRKRLLLLVELFPPPEGYVVFPEELNT